MELGHVPGSECPSLVTISVTITKLWTLNCGSSVCLALVMEAWLHGVKLPPELSQYICLCRGWMPGLYRHTSVYRECITFRFLCIMPTILRVYSGHQSNPIVTQTIESTCHKFFILHRNPFIVQVEHILWWSYVMLIHMCIQTYMHKHANTDRQTDRQTHTHTHTH